MQVSSLQIDDELIYEFITQKVAELSPSDLETLVSNPFQIELFVTHHLESDILVNELKRNIIPEMEYYDKKLLLLRVGTLLLTLLPNTIKE